MNNKELRNLAGRKNVPLGTIHKDYVLTVTLKYISDLPYSKKLVFKGGTCIKKIYFDDARFLVDLDFTCLEDISQEILEDLKEELENRKIKNIDFRELNREEGREDSTRHKVKYRDMNGHPNSIKIDLSTRRKPSRKGSMKRVLNPYYSKIPDFKVRAMSLEEILAEKIRAIIIREAPRDIYDTWYLLRRGVKPDIELINEKLETLKSENKFVWKKFIERMADKQETWDRDLMTLVPDAPEFTRVITEVERFMSSRMK